MKSGLRMHRSCSLRVAEAASLPADMRDQVRELIDVESTNPRKGHATSLMWEVCNEADFACLMLMVQPKRFAEGMDDDQLIRFYGKFGFVKIQDEPCVLMARSPQVPRIIPVLPHNRMARV